SERPDLADRAGEVESTFAEFIHNADVTTRYWHRLREDLPDFQLVLYDEERDEVVGRGQTMPASMRDGLPGGVDDMLERRFGDGPAPEPDVLSALVAIVDRRRQGEGLSGVVIDGMRTVAS